MPKEKVDPYVSDLSNRTLRVVTLAADGFVLISDVDKDGNNVTGNDRFRATESWYKPLVMGDSPTPRSGHSAVLLGERLVVFGGWDAPVCYNDVSILDLCLMDWTQPEVTGKPPAPRSWHTAVPLSSNSFLVHGGYDGDEVMGDSFIFSLDTCSWSALADSVPISPCCGHQGLALPRTLQDKENQEDYNRQAILIFGGGDNNGHFFNQLHRHTVSHDASGTAVGDTWCW
uniref:Uncharacterized protein n=1 Tax=Branchiostoma floridae TaxID=7739 RepID=C3ZQI0_BRAFL|eukprot:XP_002589225.1 hypothetical protein BRAFLDRAFT_74617 [Branchiostoma floridae]